MMKFVFSLRSKNNLRGVHPDLVKVVERALELTSVDFMVIEGVRSYDRQKALFAAGASRTMNSRHLTGHAVDLMAIVDGKGRWDWPLYDKIAQAVRMASMDLKIPIVWGGDWPKFRDGPHFELQRKHYPAETT